ncbi:MAG: hypothetical protein J1E00_07895 [Oscillospiraceae bacterium]|nr:hypothetical protein [Oscillospiraceae bacterium]
MKKTLAGVLLAAGLLCGMLCTLAGCGKGSSAGEETKVRSYEIPTEYIETSTNAGETVSVTFSIAFEENQLTIIQTYESSRDSLTRTYLYLLDEYGNVVREICYDEDGERYIYDYAYDPYGNLQMECSYWREGGAPDSLTTYLCKGEQLYYTLYSNRTYGNSQGMMTYVYDENGRLVKSETVYSTYTFRYDEQGNFTEQIFDYGDGDVTTTTYENTYEGDRLTARNWNTDGRQGRETVGKYRSFQMTEGQYRCVRLLSQHGDASIFHGTGAGSGEIRYADGTPYKRVKQNEIGNPLAVTYYLPGGAEDYTRVYNYNRDGSLGGMTFRSASGETTLIVDLTDSAWAD